MISRPRAWENDLTPREPAVGKQVEALQEKELVKTRQELRQGDGRIANTLKIILLESYKILKS